MSIRFLPGKRPEGPYWAGQLIGYALLGLLLRFSVLCGTMLFRGITDRWPFYFYMGTGLCLFIYNDLFVLRWLQRLAPEKGARARALLVVTALPLLFDLYTGIAIPIAVSLH